VVQIHPPQPSNQQLARQCKRQSIPFPQEFPQSQSECQPTRQSTKSIHLRLAHQRPHLTERRQNALFTKQPSSWSVSGLNQGRHSARALSAMCEFRPCVFALFGQSEVVFREECRLKPDTTSQIEPLLLTEKQAANRLNISVSTLRRWREKYAIPVIKIGGILRYLAADLDSFVTDHLSSAEVA
jgi:excisionase family DNA binding protein